jgi:hypothetical protein
MNPERAWTVYRTRFVVRARQLTDSLRFTDALGREQCGQAGDYLVEIFDGLFSITPRKFFEDIYVPLEPASDDSHAHSPRSPSRNVLPDRPPTRPGTEPKLRRHSPIGLDTRGSPLNRAPSFLPRPGAPLIA